MTIVFADSDINYPRRILRPPCISEKYEDRAPKEVCEMMAPICMETKVDFLLQMIRCKAQQSSKASNEKVFSLFFANFRLIFMPNSYIVHFAYSLHSATIISFRYSWRWEEMWTLSAVLKMECVNFF
uniref:Uncharacterized protein n=1 Tax=Parascaris univalens TaxID=6257 RepID=A0A915A3U9_PARUN